MNEDQAREGGNDDNEEVCMDEDFAASLENFAEKYSDFNRNCDPKVGIIIFCFLFKISYTNWMLDSIRNQ